MRVAGTIVLVLAALAFLSSWWSQRRAAKLAAVRQTTAAEVAAMPHGAGVIELAGVIESPSPLLAPLSQRACVWYSMSVERRWQEDRWTNDSSGNRTRHTDNRSETVDSRTDSVDFTIADASGRVIVMADGASWDCEERSVSRVEPGTGAGITFGSITIDLPALLDDRRNEELHYSEELVPVGKHVYVTGVPVAGADGTAVGRGDDRVLVTARSREQRLSSATKSARGLRLAAMVGAVIGLVLLAVGLATG